MKPWPVVIAITVCLVSVVGCAPHTAVIAGKSVPRVDLGYSDRHHYFAVGHWDAYPLPLDPSGGQWTYGGHVAGRVCGVDVNFFADYYGRRLAVDGYYRGGDLAVRYSVSDDGQGRHIEGTLGVDIVMTRQTLEVDILRRLNYRRLHLKDDGSDTFAGTVEIFGYEFPYAIRGMHVLFSMPPEDQAVVLPLMLACPTVMPDGHGEQIFGFDLTGESYEGGRHRPIAAVTTPKT